MVTKINVKNVVIMVIVDRRTLDVRCSSMLYKTTAKPIVVEKAASIGSFHTKIFYAITFVIL